MEKQGIKGFRHPYLWGVLACAAALLLSALAVVCRCGSDSTHILEGVTVDQVAVGGMSREGAEAYLERVLLPRYQNTRVLFCQDGALVADLTCAAIGAAPDLAAAVEAAWAVGHFGGKGWVDSFRRGWFYLFGERQVDIRPQVLVDAEQLDAVLPAAPQNAWYDVETGQVMEGGIGVEVDAAALARQLSASGPGEAVEFPVRVVEQEITAEDLRKVLFRDVLGACTTTVGGSSVRRNNVALSAAAINGLVLGSGDVFDYNAAVGERTTARGYGAAPAYVNGATVDSIGGGICQTSSTLYLAALLANLEIVERYAHRYVSGYITMGMDATVSWGGPEFRFRNDTGYPIRIDTAIKNGALTVTIYGTKLDDTYVKMTYKVLSTQNYSTKYRETASLDEGETRVQQSGYVGYTVQTYRNVYDGAGNLLTSTPEARSVYKSRDRILLVGTKKTAAPEPEREAEQTETPAVEMLDDPLLHRRLDPA